MNTLSILNAADNQTDSVARDSKGGSGPVPSGKLPNLSALAK